MSERLIVLLQKYVGPKFVGEEFNCILEARLDRYFVLPPGRHDSLAMRRLLGRAQLRDVLDDDMEIAEEERAVPAFQVAAHTLFLHSARRWLGKFTDGEVLCEFSAH